MIVKIYIIFLIFFHQVALLPLLWIGSTDALPAPHIIYIMVDDMGWNDIGYRTTTELVTPTLTDLATKDGVRLERYYTAPTCGPSRSQFLSGMCVYTNFTY